MSTTDNGFPEQVVAPLPDEHDLATLFDDGILQEINRRLLHPRGLTLAVVPRTGHARLFTNPHPEGVLYSNDAARNAEWVEHGRAKAERFDALLRPEREARLGFVVQPLPADDTVAEYEADDRG